MSDEEPQAYGYGHVRKDRTKIPNQEEIYAHLTFLGEYLGEGGPEKPTDSWLIQQTMFDLALPYSVVRMHLTGWKQFQTRREKTRQLLRGDPSGKGN